MFYFMGEIAKKRYLFWKLNTIRNMLYKMLSMVSPTMWTVVTTLWPYHLSSSTNSNSSSNNSNFTSTGAKCNLKFQNYSFKMLPPKVHCHIMFYTHRSTCKGVWASFKSLLVQRLILECSKWCIIIEKRDI